MATTENDVDSSSSSSEEDSTAEASPPTESVTGENDPNPPPVPHQLVPGTYIRAVFKINDELRTILFEPDAYELAMNGGMPSFLDIDAHHKLAYIPK